LKKVAGKYSLHDKTNKNGELLVQFAERNQLVIKTTCFQHKNIHKGTWKIPGTTEVNQIDHILISNRHASNIIDVRTARGPNCDSDHFLVKTVLRARLLNIGKSKGNARIQWNIEKLQQPENIKQYQQKLATKLQEEKQKLYHVKNVDSKWEIISRTIKESAKEIVGTKEEENEEWFDQECRKAIEIKKTTIGKL